MFPVRSRPFRMPQGPNSSLQPTKSNTKLGTRLPYSRQYGSLSNWLAQNKHTKDKPNPCRLHLNFWLQGTWLCALLCCPPVRWKAHRRVDCSVSGSGVDGVDWTFTTCPTPSRIIPTDYMCVGPFELWESWGERLEFDTTIKILEQSMGKMWFKTMLIEARIHMKIGPLATIPCPTTVSMVSRDAWYVSGIIDI